MLGLECFAEGRAEDKQEQSYHRDCSFENRD